MIFDVEFATSVEASDEKTARFFVAHLLSIGAKCAPHYVSEAYPNGLPDPQPKFLSYGGIKAVERP